MRTKMMVRRETTGTMAEVLAEGPICSSSCFCLSSDPRPWPSVDVVMSSARVRFLSKDWAPAGSMGCAVDCEAGGRCVGAGEPVSKGALCVGSGTWVLGGGKSSWKAALPELAYPYSGEARSKESEHQDHS